MKPKHYRFVIECFLILNALSHFAFAKTSSPKPYLMLTVGDSISAGFLANTNAEDQSHSYIQPYDTFAYRDQSFVSGEPFPKHNIPEWKLRLAQLLNQKDDLSWSSGEKIQSHFVKLQKSLNAEEPNAKLVIKNVAMAGAMTADLDGEADDILKIWKSGDYRSIKYITLLIGATDSCVYWYDGGVPEDQMMASIDRFFEKLSAIEQNEKIRVLVSSIPKIPDLSKPEIFNYPVSPKSTCRDQDLNVNKYCVPLLSAQTPDDYLKNVETIQRKNRAIRDLVVKMKLKFKKFDFAFSESLYHYPIEIKYMAKDCFHPNSEGQETISELLWKDQPWFK